MTDILQYIYISFINPVSGTDVYRHILFYWYKPPTADYILWPASAALHRLHAIRVFLTFKQEGHFDRQ